MRGIDQAYASHPRSDQRFVSSLVAGGRHELDLAVAQRRTRRINGRNAPPVRAAHWTSYDHRRRAITNHRPSNRRRVGYGLIGWDLGPRGTFSAERYGYGGCQRAVIPKTEANGQVGPFDARPSRRTAVSLHQPNAHDIERPSAIQRAGREVVEITCRGLAEQGRVGEHGRGRVSQPERRDQNERERQKRGPQLTNPPRAKHHQCRDGTGNRQGIINPQGHTMVNLEKQALRSAALPQ